MIDFVLMAGVLATLTAGTVVVVLVSDLVASLLS